MKKVLAILAILIVAMSFVFAASIGELVGVKRSPNTSYDEYKVSFIWELMNKQVNKPSSGSVQFVSADALKSVVNAEGFPATNAVANRCSLVEHIVFGGLEDGVLNSSNASFLGWADAAGSDDSGYIALAYNKNSKTLYFITYRGPSETKVNIVFPADSSSMFSGFTALKDITVGPYCTVDFSGITNMTNMFNGDAALTTLDLSGFNLDSSVNITGAFNGCSSLAKIIVPATFSDASAPYATGSVFLGCTNLNGELTYSDTTDPELSYRLVKVPFTGNGVEFAKSASSGGYFTKAGEQIYAKALGALNFTDRIEVLVSAETSGMEDANIEVVSLNVQGTGNDVYQLENDGSDDCSIKYSTVLITEPFYVNFYNGGNRVATRTTSVAGVAKNYINTSTESQANKDLCVAFLNFGTAMQQYVAASQGSTVADANLANDGLTDAQKTYSTTIGSISDGNIDFTIMPTSKVTYSYNGAIDVYPTASSTFGGAFLGNSLLFNDDISSRHSFTLNSGVTWDDYTITITSLDGLTDLTAKVVTGQSPVNGVPRHYIAYESFAIAEIDDGYVLTITNKTSDDVFKITYSPMSYMNGAIQQKISTELKAELKNLCAAVYWFNNKADAAFSN